MESSFVYIARDVLSGKVLCRAESYEEMWRLLKASGDIRRIWSYEVKE